MKITVSPVLCRTTVVVSALTRSSPIEELTRSSCSFLSTAQHRSRSLRCCVPGSGFRGLRSGSASNGGELGTGRRSRAAVPSSSPFQGVPSAETSERTVVPRTGRPDRFKERRLLRLRVVRARNKNHPGRCQ